MPNPPGKIQTFIGVDPGKSGGIAVLFNNGLAKLYPMPETLHDLWELVRSFSDYNAHCLIEQVHAMPKQGAVSMFTFGRGLGNVEAHIVAADIPYEFCTPQRWQKGLHIPQKKKTEQKPAFKKRLRAFAQRLYPNLDITLETCDALLIATFLQREYGGRL